MRHKAAFRDPNASGAMADRENRPLDLDRAGAFDPVSRCAAFAVALFPSPCTFAGSFAPWSRLESDGRPELFPPSDVS